MVVEEEAGRLAEETEAAVGPRPAALDDAREIGIGEVDADDMAVAGRGQFAGERDGRLGCRIGGSGQRFTMIGHAGFPFAARPDREPPDRRPTGWHF